MPEMDDKTTLSTFANGGVEELFQIKMQEILANVHNVNTEPDSKREMNIKLIFKPDEDRRTIVTAVQVSVKLASTKGTATILFTGDAKRDGKYPMVEHNPKQMRLSELDQAGTKPTPAPQPETAPPTAQ